MWKKIKDFFKNKAEVITPIYRLVDISKNNDADYEVTIQTINKNRIFTLKPEEILSDDNFVDRFSPRDIRALTYLGYLEINSPKYTILAKRLATENDKILFALKRKGEKKTIVKTAQEIYANKEMLENLNSNDAHIIGYTVAAESIVQETEVKKKLLSEIEKD